MEARIPSKTQETRSNYQYAELTRTETFDIQKFANKDFFVQVFTSLVKQSRKGNPSSEKTKEYRELIHKYHEEYCSLSDYTPIELKNSQQIAIYECTKIEVAYTNAVKLQFGNKFRMFINRLTDQKTKANKRREELKKAKKSDSEIKDIIYAEITQPCTQLKIALAAGNARNLPTSILSEGKMSLIEEFFNTYGADYTFEKGNLYYDVKIH
ncbi:hypothetical protein [Parasitella parasitica]|uniref:Uncharacterized protein n=1 Tax=Parasitella parasitica TaxID=35722 RepID=A0A0B7MVA8_9FUNG|nr:hypothetical protein [Parasitella parasitica]